MLTFSRWYGSSFKMLEEFLAQPKEVSASTKEKSPASFRNTLSVDSNIVDRDKITTNIKILLNCITKTV